MKFKDYIDPTWSNYQIDEKMDASDRGENPDTLHLVVLGLGDEEGTFSNVVNDVAKKKKLKYTLIDVTQAYLADSDLEVGEVTFHNFDGEDKKITIHKDKCIVFVRAGAIQSLVSQALVATLGTYGFFLVNDL